MRAVPSPCASLAFRWSLPNSPPVNATVIQLTDQLILSYAKAGGINHLDGKNLPSKSAIASFTADLLRLLFPGFFDDRPWDVGNNPKTAVMTFLQQQTNFVVDTATENKLMVTVAPGGFLKRVDGSPFI